MNNEREKFEKEKEQQDQLVASEIKKGVKDEEKLLKATIKAEIEEDRLEQFQLLQEELTL